MCKNPRGKVEFISRRGIFESWIVELDGLEEGGGGGGEKFNQGS